MLIRLPIRSRFTYYTSPILLLGHTTLFSPDEPWHSVISSLTWVKVYPSLLHSVSFLDLHAMVFATCRYRLTDVPHTVSRVKTEIHYTDLLYHSSQHG